MKRHLQKWAMLFVVVTLSCITLFLNVEVSVPSELPEFMKPNEPFSGTGDWYADDDGYLASFRAARGIFVPPTKAKFILDGPVPDRRALLGPRNQRRFLSYGMFNASRSMTSTLSFFFDDDPALPPPCPLLTTTAADTSNSNSKSNSVAAAPKEGCWRHACQEMPQLPAPCFGGCRCPIGPCRVVSILHRKGTGEDARAPKDTRVSHTQLGAQTAGAPILDHPAHAKHTVGRAGAVHHADGPRAPGVFTESLHCVDSSDLYVQPTLPYDDNVGKKPLPEHRPKAKVTFDRRERWRHLKPLVCPTSPPADPPLSMPWWPRLPVNSTLETLLPKDPALRQLVSLRDHAEKTGVVTSAAEITDQIKDRVDELVSGGTAPPEYQLNMTHAEKLSIFQRATSWRTSFPRWRKWEGKCAAPRHGGRMRGYHSHKDGFYRLENVCFGTGLEPAISGYEPLLEDFEGTDEHALEIGGHDAKSLQRDFRKFLSSTQTIRPARASSQSVKQSPPTKANSLAESREQECFLDTPTALMPRGPFAQLNHGHAARIAMTTLSALSEWFPSAGTPRSTEAVDSSKLTTARQFSSNHSLENTSPGNKDPRGSAHTQGREAQGAKQWEEPLMIYLDEPNRTMSAMDLYAPLFSKYAAHIFSRSVKPGLPGKNVFPPATPPTSRMCFKSVVVAHVCRTNGRQRTPCHYDDPDAPAQTPDPESDLPLKFRGAGTPSAGKLNSELNNHRNDEPVNRTNVPSMTGVGPHTRTVPSGRNGKAPLLPVPEMQFRGLTPDKFIPRGNQHKFVLHGRRGPSDVRGVQRLRQRVSECLGVPLRKKVRKTKPHVLYALRTLRRPDPSGTRYGDIAEACFDRGAGRFTAVEFGWSDPAQYFRNFIDADILIGPYGSGLTWQYLMPPEGVVAVLQMFFIKNIGWSEAINRTLISKQPVGLKGKHAFDKFYYDYLGDGQAAHQTILATPSRTDDWKGGTDLSQLAPAHLLRTLDGAWCALTKGYDAAPRECSLFSVSVIVSKDVVEQAAAQKELASGSTRKKP